MTAPPHSRSEDRVGPYRLQTRIGEGGMGVVHLAHGPDGRRVALKVLRQHIVGDDEARERLAREVSSLRRITSPRIAEILDADPHGPTPYVVTRYVPGLSLFHHVAEEGPVVGPDLLHLADCLAEALQAVHAVGVLHRDVKPTNVLMEGRSPVLIDFGLARLAEDPRLTQTGFLLGTPGYLAPEILYGDDATPAADVHAWAATVVFAATGRAPYGRGPAMAIMDRVRRGEHDLDDVPHQLVPLLSACLSAEPWQRPTLPEVRQRLGDLRAAAGVPTGLPAEQDLWTMPFHPAEPDDGDGTEEPRTRIAPLGAPVAAGVPVRETEPYQSPSPLEPRTQAIPAQRSEQPPAPQVAPAPRQPSRVQQSLQLLGLGALTTALVAAAPYVGTALVAVVVLVVRTTSVTRQRHQERRLLRGRPRWYDVPATGLAVPGYVVVAALGAVSDVVLAGFAGLAAFALGYLMSQPTSTCLLLAGIGFTPVLWWGPWSGRLRSTTRSLVRRTARSEFGGWLVVAMSLLGTAALVGLLLGQGPDWAPALGPPGR